MTIPDPTAMLTGRVQALRSVWCWYRPAQLLIDCGDGCTVDLGRHVGAPRLVALTHGHSDHILGLPNLLLARQLPSLVSGGPVTVLYPDGTPQITGLRTGISAMWPHTVWDRVTWRALSPGDRVALSPTRDLVAFATRHVDYATTLGYAVVERRTRLPAHLAALTGAEIGEYARAHGRAAVQETVERTEFLHTGDTLPCDIPLMQGARLAVVDATFLDDADRDHPTHATVAEALAMSQGATHVVLHHLSQRYDRSTLVGDVRDRVVAAGVPLDRVTLWDDTRWLPLAP